MNTISLLISIGNIPALDHIWLVGDIFLSIAVESLNVVKKAVVEHRQLHRWHMLNRYDIRCWYSSFARDPNPE